MTTNFQFHLFLSLLFTNFHFKIFIKKGGSKMVRSAKDGDVLCKGGGVTRKSCKKQEGAVGFEGR